MARSLTHDRQVFVANLWKRVKRVAQRREPPMDAIRGIGEDFHKLRHGYKVSRRSDEEKEARRLLKKGRKAYNEKNYSDAENYLMRALEHDEQLAWAHCFLGYTLYKLGRPDEATNHWNRAVVCDPNSDAADKARKKLEGLNAKRRETLEDMAANLQQSQRSSRDS